MRALPYVVVQLAVATFTSIVGAQSSVSNDTPQLWTPKNIVEFHRRYVPQIESLAAYAGRPCPKGDRPEDRQLRHDRAGALRTLLALNPAVRANDIATNNLALYDPFVLATQDRYELTDWPGADALVRMGSVALPAVFERMEDHCDELDVRLLAQLFASIDGRELAVLRLKIYQREHPRNPKIPEDEAPLHFNIRKVLALLEDLEFSKGKYSPTKYYTTVLKKG